MAHPDFDALLRETIPFAQKMLAKNGEFYPFGATMSVEGKPSLAMSYTGIERPAPAELTDLLLAGFREEADKGEIRSAVVCYNASVVHPKTRVQTDAIKVLFFGEGMSPETYCLPYSITGRFRRSVEYGEPFTQAQGS